MIKFLLQGSFPYFLRQSYSKSWLNFRSRDLNCVSESIVGKTTSFIHTGLLTPHLVTSRHRKNGNAKTEKHQEPSGFQPWVFYSKSCGHCFMRGDGFCDWADVPGKLPTLTAAFVMHDVADHMFIVQCLFRYVNVS